MQSLDAKRLAGAVLGVLVFLVAVRVLEVAILEPRNLSRPAYILKGLVQAHPSGGAPLPPEAMPDWSRRLATADISEGRRLAGQCAGCHDLSPARKTIGGPGLYGVVGRPRGSLPGFAYSDAMKGAGGAWTPGNLFVFLRDPQLAVPGTRMSFGGLEDPQQRVDLIAYLRSNGPGAAASGASRIE